MYFIITSNSIYDSVLCLILLILSFLKIEKLLVKETIEEYKEFHIGKEEGNRFLWKLLSG